jgi:hypothetical protein
MKVYHPEGTSMTLMVAPAALMPENERPSDWMENGKPRRFDLKFEEGVLEVDSKLGAWLIENGHVNKTPLRRITRQLIH